MSDETSWRDWAIATLEKLNQPNNKYGTDAAIRMALDSEIDLLLMQVESVAPQESDITSYGKGQIPPDLLEGIETDVAKKNKRSDQVDDDFNDQDETTEHYESDEEGNPELDSRYGTDDDPRIPKE